MANWNIYQTDKWNDYEVVAWEAHAAACFSLILDDTQVDEVVQFTPK